MKKADRKKEHFRNEWKYLISTSEKEVLNLRMNMIKGLAYSPSAPCEWGMNIWQRTCTASLAFQPPRLLCDRAANYGSIIIGVPDDGTIQFSRCARSDALPCGRCRLGNCPFTYEPSRRVNP